MFYYKFLSFIFFFLFFFFFFFSYFLIGFFFLFSTANDSLDFDFYATVWLLIVRIVTWSSSGVIFFNTYETDWWFLFQYKEIREGVSGSTVGIHLFLELMFLTFFLFYFTSIYRKKKNFNSFLNINNIELILFIYFVSFLIIFFIVFIPIFIKFFFLNNFVYYSKSSLFFFLFVYLSSYVYLVWFSNSVVNSIVRKFYL